MAQYVPPVSIHTLTHTAPGLVIHYPQVYGLMNPGAEEAINRAIIVQIQDMRVNSASSDRHQPANDGHF